MTALLREGKGWRVGWDDERENFKALVGGDNWALELTQDEFEALRRLAQQLATIMASLASELMPDEQISCEQETSQIWMEAEGFHHSYSLRFILLNGRGAEGAWPSSTVPEVLNGLTHIDVF
ncbi:hypothetical protein N836_33985 [Leptolyngbya sp. Heron Island J]|uniref:DUF1818 family protein n=1 Tax=Leptolyngbya sp. Heron Island J TaxID=1385935 RepID=UPI0003B9C19F|nr:DUF1818 family protein [Leptolyngbya sp. Heron Island J]ESA38090.1 hypothetical protein N836_33985 [Leptolyngbya sp. Heron Island J]